MPRFFFHVVNGTFDPDDTGLECANADEVKAAAVTAAGEMLRSQGLSLWKTRHFDMFVTDEQNRTHFKLSFTAEDLTGELE